MKRRKRFVPYILLAVCMLCLFGCENDISDPSDAILGKWELEEFTIEGEPQPFEPYGDVEFLSDGKMKKFYESQVYGPVQSYWFEEISDFLVIGTIDFSYGTVRGYAFSYEFVNKNVLKLELKQLIGFHESIMQPEIYIYKRKK